MKISKEIISALERAKIKIKKIEMKPVLKEYRAGSAWLGDINDIIDRTVLAVRDELESIK
ncbi:hypothetical protein LCGC14_0475540 [marine sediment metagenome]|uniref:Uncharacterized protein n=1 Tax=marine sediment metagenome TaxID=412755 RepID=A0A0F9UXW2_9ZZZZ